MRPLPCLSLSLVALALPASAQVTVDGSISGDGYGAARAVQTVNTQFVDNVTELDAAYATIEGGRLYLALTGNTGDFNKLEIFIDSVPGGENVFSGVPGNDGTGWMTGLTFDAGFEADLHLIASRGFLGTPRFDLDVAVLGTASFSQHLDVFGGASQGVGTTGTGPGNGSPIEVGYDDSNVAGVVAGTGAANTLAALAVTTGLELSIDLADLGNPSGDVRIMVFQNNADHRYVSNQFLAGLPAPQGNLGGDGFGTFTGTVVFDMADWGGDQFFTIPNSLGSNYCSSSANSTGAAALMSAAGSASLAANDLTLSAGPVPDAIGLFYYGPSQISVPFGNGTRCISGSVVRLEPATVSSGGSATRVVDLLGGGFLPGIVHFQYLFRDPAAMGSSLDLSDGYTISFVP